MKVKIAKCAGFCMGVNRAFELAEKLLKEKKKVFALGEIVHNKTVRDYLEQKGLVIVKHVNELKNKKGVLIIRAHGIPDDLRKKIKDSKIEYHDATCPYVTKIKNIAERLQREGYYILIFGDKNHAELKTIKCNLKNCRICETVDEFKSLPPMMNKKIALITQTTQSIENFKMAINILVDKIYELRIFNTICDATRTRQESAVELAGQVDLMIVMGSEHSANTNRLYQMCKTINPNVVRIDNINELDKKWLKNKKIIGITAGASTPQSVIDEASQYIKKYKSF
ncbi:MAG: 4-hydroxy-3-methylbut-2-enyl diphosphate reductase [Spirochaetes bacterium]|nr:4-hydroxy-3-methylbut-2-enyl diphosphate reductase [Spirochaetota bacterium]